MTIPIGDSDTGVEAEEHETEETQQPRAWERMLCALLVLSVGVVLLAGSLELDGGLGYQVVGPAVFPQIVGTGALLCGVLLVIGEIRSLIVARNASVHEIPRHDTRWGQVGLMAGTLFVYALVLQPVGFWQASGVLFVVLARILGSRKWVRDTIIGFALALTAYFLFDRLLQVQLPDGFFHLAG